MHQVNYLITVKATPKESLSQDFLEIFPISGPNGTSHPGHLETLVLSALRNIPRGQFFKTMKIQTFFMVFSFIPPQSNVFPLDLLV